jgi:hypothetical protein
MRRPRIARAASIAARCKPSNVDRITSGGTRRP